MPKYLTVGLTLALYSDPISSTYANFVIANNEDEVILTDNIGPTERDRVVYDGGPEFPDPNGASMVFMGPDTADNNVGANWTTSTTTFGDGDLGSPGTQGSSEVPVALKSFSVE